LPEGLMFSLQSKYTVLLVRYKRSVTKEPDTFQDSTGVRIKLGRNFDPVYFVKMFTGSGNMTHTRPGTGHHVVQSICTPENLIAATDGNRMSELRIIAMQHMHRAGIAMESEVLHANHSSTHFGVVPRYGMSAQKMMFLSSDVLVSRGDALRVTCVYDSPQREGATLAGPNLVEEMCFSYILVSSAPLFFNRGHHL